MNKKRKGPLWLCGLGALLVLFALVKLLPGRPVLEYALPASAALPAPGAEEDASAPAKRLIKSLEPVRETLTGAVSDLALCGMKSGLTASAGENSAPCTLYAVTDGWFEICSVPLADGYLPGVAELTQGAKVAALDEKLAFTLFGAEEPLGQKVNLGGAEYTVIGLARHRRGVGQLDEYAAWVPLLAAGETEFETVTLSARPVPGSGASVMFESTVKSAFIPGGSFYDADKEVMRATMILRLLLLCAGLFFLLGLLKWMNGMVLGAMDRFRERLKEEYLKRLLPRLIGGILLAIVCYGAWVGAVYLLMNYSIQPLYVFTEWVPENIVEYESWKNVFWNLVNAQNQPVTVTTRLMNEIRLYGQLLRFGVVAALVGLLLYRLQPAKKQ